MRAETYGGFFDHADLTDAEVDEIQARFEPVTDDLRRLVDVTIRSEVGDAEVAAAREHLAAAAELLGRCAKEGPARVVRNDTGRSWQWGNAVVGQRNAVAPPMVVERHDDGSTSARLSLGNAYEGPPGMVHGGVSALLLDHLMGVTASSMKKLTMTGTLTLRYRRPLLLGEVALAGRVVSDTGRKVTVTAEINGADGAAIEAEGLFIVPSWAPSPD
ncbi:PaaI family thioesterase [Nocardioides sp.]|uniref:PaaI family thioesterase n=1 Tax=Nocardioides sp. TaxID=35761 RepID=UPI00261DBAB9|nr:PaaI family thioesterase [Nocardioides sp.]